MVDTDKRNIAVVGAGFMGTVIATVYARHGYRVRITDVSPEVLATFGERARPIVSSLVDEQMDTDAILANVKPEPSIDAAVIHENLGAKQDLFARLISSVCPRWCSAQTHRLSGFLTSASTSVIASGCWVFIT